MEDFVAALCLESLPLAVAVDEVGTSLVSGTGIQHKEERQDRTGNFFPTKSRTGHPLMKPLLTPTHLHTETEWGAEQHPGNVMLEAERERGIL